MHHYWQKKPKKQKNIDGAHLMVKCDLNVLGHWVIILILLCCITYMLHNFLCLNFCSIPFFLKVLNSTIIEKDKAGNNKLLLFHCSLINHFNNVLVKCIIEKKKKTELRTVLFSLLTNIQTLLLSIIHHSVHFLHNRYCMCPVEVFPTKLISIFDYSI